MDNLVRVVLPLLRIAVGLVRIMFGYSGSPQPIWEVLNAFLRDPCSIQSGFLDHLLVPEVAKYLGVVLIMVGGLGVVRVVLSVYLASLNALVIRVLMTLRTIFNRRYAGYRGRYYGVGGAYDETEEEESVGSPSLVSVILILVTGLLFSNTATSPAVLSAIGNVVSGIFTLGAAAILNFISFALTGSGVCSV